MSGMKKFLIDMFAYISAAFLYYGLTMLYCYITNQVPAISSRDLIMMALLFTTLMTLNTGMVKYENTLLKCLPSLVALALDAVLCFKYLSKYKYVKNAFYLFATIIVINLIVELFWGNPSADVTPSSLHFVQFVFLLGYCCYYAASLMFLSHLNEMVDQTILKFDRYPYLYAIFCVVALFSPFVIAYNLKCSYDYKSSQDRQNSNPHLLPPGGRYRLARSQKTTTEVDSIREIRKELFARQG